MSDLTKRELLAGMAMQGLLSNCGGPIQGNPQCGWKITNCTENDVAGYALVFADALLAELEKTEPKPVADDDGWIAHKPGDADGPPDDAACCGHIEVRFRNNETQFIRNPNAQHWTCAGGPHTIIAWRPAR